MFSPLVLRHEAVLNSFSSRYRNDMPKVNAYETNGSKSESEFFCNSVLSYSNFLSERILVISNSLEKQY